jgi:hypothetical protein
MTFCDSLIISIGCAKLRQFIAAFLGSPSFPMLGCGLNQIQLVRILHRYRSARFRGGAMRLTLVLMAVAVTVCGCVSSPTLVSETRSPEKGGVVSFGKYPQPYRQIKMNDKVKATVQAYCGSEFEVLEQSSESVKSLNGASVTPASGDDAVVSFRCRQAANAFSAGTQP